MNKYDVTFKVDDIEINGDHYFPIAAKVYVASRHQRGQIEKLEAKITELTHAVDTLLTLLIGDGAISASGLESELGLTIVEK